MIERIYIDNYRCFTNFEWKPQALSLLLGDNGAGKTSMFDVMETLRDFLTKGVETETSFPAHALTSWDTRQEQTFELGMAGNEGQYTYRLVIEHYDERQHSRIKLEQLLYDDLVLYSYCDNDAHLYRDNGSPGPVFPFSWSRSAIATIPARNDNRRLTWFRERLERVYVLAPVPHLMSALTERETARPNRYLDDYASWLRFLHNDARFTHDLMKELGSVMDGFEHIQFKPVSETAKKLLFAFDFAEENSTRQKSVFTVPFDCLSDGQRCLAALYTALLAVKGADVSVLWDEPDNYVALREIQPWLAAVQEMAEEEGKQCLLISHHPELINSLAAEHGALFYREAGGPTRVKPFEWQEGGVRPAEIVALGWEE